jgi:hypothetical protein
MDVWNLDQYFPPNLKISWKQNAAFMSIFDFRQDPLHMIALAYQHMENIVDCLAVQ